jgi:hypothetical protein
MKITRISCMSAPWPRIADRLGLAGIDSGVEEARGHGLGGLLCEPGPGSGGRICLWLPAMVIKTLSLGGGLPLQRAGRIVPRAFPPGRDTGMRRRSRCFRGGSVKSPTTVFPGSNPGPATRAAGQARCTHRAWRREGAVPDTAGAACADAETALPPAARHPGDQPGCENTRSGTAAAKRRRAAKIR